MEKFIIQYLTVVNGKPERLYHQNISPSTNREAMNVYVESVHSHRYKAKTFYDKEEAKRVCKMFSRKHHIGTVINK